MTTLALGAVMLAAAGLGYARSRVAAVLLVVLSAFWIAVSVRPEGPILWSITPDHGVVLADLWGLLGLIVGVVLVVRGPARARGRQRPRAGRPGR
jgi:hypothetical protein